MLNGAVMIEMTKDVSSYFYKSKEIFDRLMKREKVYLKKEQRKVKKCSF